MPCHGTDGAPQSIELHALPSPMYEGMCHALRVHVCNLHCVTVLDALCILCPPSLHSFQNTTSSNETKKDTPLEENFENDANTPKRHDSPHGVMQWRDNAENPGDAWKYWPLHTS